MRREPTDGDSTEMATLFRLLGDATRLQLLGLMAEAGPDGITVSDLCDRVGMAQPAVSHHLCLMRISGVVQCRRSGKHNFYSIPPAGRLGDARAHLDALAAGSEVVAVA